MPSLIESSALLISRQMSSNGKILTVAEEQFEVLKAKVRIVGQIR